MAVLAQCTGLRAEEVLALEWQDIDFENLSMRVVRAVVHGRVKTVKTEDSEDELPLDPGFADILLTWKRRSEAEREAQNGFSTPLVGLDLVFPSTSTSDGKLRESMRAWVAIPSATPILPGWTAARPPSVCSRNSCGTLRFRRR